MTSAASRCAVLLALGSVVWAGAPAVRADEAAPETDPLNHAYAVYLGSGLYVAGGRSVFIVRVAPALRIRSEKEHPFGIRIRLNATFGFYDLNPGDFQNFEIPERLATFALVPGVEFPIRIYDNWTLRPFIDYGPATDTEFRELTWVLGLGIRSRAEFHDARHAYLLWNEFIRARNSSTAVSATDHYALLRTDFELRGLVRYRLGKRPFDLGLVTGLDLNFDSVLVDIPLGEPVTIGYRWELGLSTGSTVAWKHFRKLITAPRLGISYRAGEGESSVVFSLRFRN